MAFIYKLICNGKTYVGSTENVYRRMASHKTSCHSVKSENYNHKVYKYIRANGGWDNVDIHILQECNKGVKKDIEDFYMKHYNCELNDRSCILDETKYSATVYKYRINHNDRYNKKYVCICGATIIDRNKKRHFQSKKHKDYLASLASSSSLASCQSIGLK